MAGDFADYIRERRFKPNLFRDIEAEIASSAKERSAKVLVLRGPYPSDHQNGSEDADEDPLAPTHSCGKTDLLRVLGERLENNPEYRVFSFLDSRKLQLDESRFYSDIFYPALTEAFPKQLKSSGSRYTHTARVLWNRASLLVSIAMPSLFGVVGTVATLKMVEFVRKAENRDVLDAVGTFSSQHPELLALFGIGLFTVWLMHAWGKVQSSKEALASWHANQMLEDAEELESGLRERLAHDPQQLLERLAGERRTLVFLVDDVDAMDSNSVEQLMALHNAASQPMRPFVLLLCYNPQNPALLRPERSYLRQEFEPRELRRKQRDESWRIFELLPPGASQAKAWLWGYFNDARVEDIYTMLTGTFSDTETSPDLILSFFRSLDEDRKPDEPRNAPLQLTNDELKILFEKHLRRDRHASQLALSLLAGDANEKQCMEVLKFTLAFRSPRVRINHLSDAMSMSLLELEPCLETLIGRTGMLVRDGDSVAFAHGHVRALLQTAWPEWRNERERYATAIMNSSRKWKGKENADVALDAEASELAIDVLWRQGEYEYNFYGASNAGYALRYYGLRNGALGKWRHLFTRIEEDKTVWDLLYWKSTARLNPYRRTAGRQFSPYTFIPELFVTTARLYWMIGDDEAALKILARWWPEVMQKISAAGPAPRVKRLELEKCISEKNHEIEAAVCEILLRRGGPGDWDKAAAIAARYDNGKAVRRTGGENARIFGMLIEHYRRFGVGNALEGLIFLHKSSPLEKITGIVDSVRTDNLERCRAISALAECYRHMLQWPSRGIPTRITADDIKSSTLDETILDLLDVTLNQAQSTVEEFARSLKKSPATLPGVRLAEGNLLFWEGAYLALRARQFCLEALRPLRKRAASTAASAAEKRFYDTYETARRLTDFRSRCLSELTPPAAFGEKLEHLDRIEASLDRRNGTRLHRQEKEARELLPEICEAGALGIAALAKERLRMAEAVYRRLGFRRGIREVTFLRAMLDRDFTSVPNSTMRSRWAEELENACASSPELGAHLDAIHSCLAEAKWAADHDLNRAGHAVRRAIEWSDRLNLPAAQQAELACMLTAYLGNAHNLPVPLPDIIRVCETAGRLLDSLGGTGGYSSETALLGRRLDVHWWLSELYRRKAVDDTASRAAALKRSRAEVDALIDKAGRRSGFGGALNSAFFVRSKLFSEAGETVRAYQDLETALNYFCETGEDAEALQAAYDLAQLSWATSADPAWADYRERCIRHIGTLESLASRMLNRQESLGGVDRLLLARGSLLLARLQTEAERALVWFEHAFGALVSVGLFGAAILLDEEMQPLYMKQLPASVARFAAHKQRVLSAAQHLDRSREQVRFVGIARILRKYAEVAAPSSSEVKDKEDLFHAGKAAQAGAEADIVSAIQSLERAAELIADDLPQDIDVDILALLRSTYLRNGDAEKADAAERRLDHKRSLIESRDFLELARHFETAGSDFIWALEIAAQVKVENEFSLRAQERLNELRDFEQPAHAEMLLAVGAEG